MRFRAEQHLRRQGDIRAVREEGRRLDCRTFTVWWKRRAPASLGAVVLATELAADAPKAPGKPTCVVSPVVPASAPRVCVIASSAAVGPAVRRNRAKRRLREVFRQHQQLVPPGCDLLLIARAAAAHCPWPELEKKFSDACGQIPAPPAAPTSPTSAASPAP